MSDEDVQRINKDFRDRFGMPPPAEYMDAVGFAPEGTDAETERKLSVISSVEESIAPRFRDCRFDSVWLQQRVGINAIILARKVRDDWAILKGKTGAGKTSLAVAMLRAAAERGVRGEFADAEELELDSARWPLGKGAPELVRRAISAPLLVLDDVGEERPPGLAVREIVRARWAAVRPTWITTGRKRAQLVELYGVAVARRMWDASAQIWVGPVPEAEPK